MLLQNCLIFKGVYMGWIGVDLDGTLAQYGEFKGRDHIGEPIAPMLDKVKKELARGKEVRMG
jgi:hypothetical protein